MGIKKLSIKIKVGKGSIKLYNLFNGDKVLGTRTTFSPRFPSLISLSSPGDAINAVINQNFDSLSKDIIPLVEKALQKTFKRIAQKITQNFTYDQVFP